MRLPWQGGQGNLPVPRWEDGSSLEVDVVAIEDPIEMVHPEFNQIAVQPAVRITCGSVLRHVLRQDPDVIMVGQIRDPETAQNAVQAALTGHLVLSTLHTTDAASAVSRLLDLGIPPYLVRATLVGVPAQRLVRKNCVHCRESFEVPVAELRDAGLFLEREGSVTLQRGAGCLRCRGTGYLGRIGIFEVLPVSDALRSRIVAETDTIALRDLAKQEGMATLRESAVARLLEGSTSHQEVPRVTWEQD
jgi:general secretion pathway protein E